MNKPNQVTISKNYNTKILVGCGGVLILLFFIAAFMLLFVLNSDQELARYPGASQISSHSNYSGLPSSYRWDDTYHTTDNFTDVYNWYSVTFDLGAESRANGRCLLLEGNKKHLLTQRSISVFLCNAQEGQTIFVSRFTTIQLGLNNIPNINNLVSFNFR